MTEIDIALPAFGILTKDTMENTKMAFDTSVELLKEAYQEWAIGNEIDGIPKNKFPSTRMMASIKSRYNSDFDAEIYSEDRLLHNIEAGSREYDMKQSYPFGKKSRVNSHGTPYLIIPFRWGTGGKNDKGRAHFASTVPQYLVNILRQRQASRRTGGMHYEANARGELILRNEYVWGGRLSAKKRTGDIPLVYKHARNMRGMVRFDNKGGYFTFRVITPYQEPKLWIRKARRPVPISYLISQKYSAQIQDMISEAVATDIKALS